jgi:hypothetical protein
VHSVTDISMRALKPPAKGHIVLWDKSITGFGVRCSQGGTKSFFLMYGTARARYQIGRVGIITHSEARELARKFLAQRTLGKRDNPTLNFEDAVAVLLESQSERVRPSTMRDYKRLLDTHFKPKLKGKSLTEVQTQGENGAVPDHGGAGDVGGSSLFAEPLMECDETGIRPRRSRRDGEARTDRTKMFHVKHFGTIDVWAILRTQSAAKCGAGIWIKRKFAVGLSFNACGF